MSKLINRIKKEYNAVVDMVTPQSVKNEWTKKRQQQELVDWEKNGRPAPPPHIIKQSVINDFHQRSGYNVLVETGTFMGDMIEAQKGRFKKVYSIELAEKLHAKAKKRFSNDANVHLVFGNSGIVMPDVIAKLDEPAIFWLDGHYSGGVTALADKECPVYEELDAIFNDSRFDHIILIDDARLFIGTRDYPTMDELTEYVKKKNPAYGITVENDVIRVVK